jgi:hypothetical protein
MAIAFMAGSSSMLVPDAGQGSRGTCASACGVHALMHPPQAGGKRLRDDRQTRYSRRTQT